MNDQTNITGLCIREATAVRTTPWSRAIGRDTPFGMLTVVIRKGSIESSPSAPGRSAMQTSSMMAVVAGCTILLGCDLQPSVLFVTSGSPYQVIHLTDAEEGCPAPLRVCYLTLLDGGTSHGCWVRDHAYIRAHFHDLGDRLLPVTEFRRTTLAEYRNATLDEAVAADLLDIKIPSIPHPSVGTNLRSR